jgi:hypothetical protein
MLILLGVMQDLKMEDVSMHLLRLFGVNHVIECGKFLMKGNFKYILKSEVAKIFGEHIIKMDNFMSILEDYFGAKAEIYVRGYGANSIAAQEVTDEHKQIVKIYETVLKNRCLSPDMTVKQLVSIYFHILEAYKHCYWILSRSQRPFNKKAYTIVRKNGAVDNGVPLEDELNFACFEGVGIDALREYDSDECGFTSFDFDTWTAH